MLSEIAVFSAVGTTVTMGLSKLISLKALDEKKAELERKIEVLKSEENDSRDECNAAKTTLDELNCKIQKAEQKHEQKLAQLQISPQEVSQLKAEVKDLKREQIILENTIDNRNFTIAQLEQQVASSCQDKTTQKTSDSKASLQTIQKAKEKSQNKFKDRSEQIDIIESEKRELKEKHQRRLKQNLIFNQEEKAKLQAEIEYYVGCLDFVKAENRELRQQLQDYVEKSLQLSESETVKIGTEITLRSDDDSTHFIRLILRLFQLALLIHTFSDFGLLLKILFSESGIDWNEAVSVTQDMVDSVGKTIDVEEIYPIKNNALEEVMKVSKAQGMVGNLNSISNDENRYHDNDLPSQKPSVAAQVFSHATQSASADSTVSTETTRRMYYRSIAHAKLEQYREMNWELQHSNDLLKLYIKKLIHDDSNEEINRTEQLELEEIVVKLL